MELIEPLGERISQVDTIQQISLSIMQRNTLEYVVSEAVEAVVTVVGCECCCCIS